ncbi:MAG TPA: O-antigen ligase family protein, partial [Solirubrobacteraceae bacterium]|nr:O-antigen ligase family protein [Solirubrobacteraceae bacterium]
LAIAVLSTLAGVATGFAPLVAAGLAVGSVAVAIFALFPAAVLLAILVVRPGMESVADTFTVGGVNLLGMLAVGTIVAGAVTLVLHRPRLPATPAIPLAAGFLLLALVSLTWSFDPGEGFTQWTQLAFPVTVLVLTAALVRDVRGFHLVLAAVLASAAVPLAVGLLQLASGDRVVKEGFSSIQGTFVHPNGFGLFLAVVLVAGIVAWMDLRPGSTARKLVGVLLVLGLVCLMQTFARSAWGAFVLGLALVALLVHRSLILFSALTVVLMALAFPGVVEQVTGRFADLSGSSKAIQRNSLDWRTELWDRMLPYAAERPVAGNGMGTFLPLTDREIGMFDFDFQTASSRATYIEVYPHNDYVYVGVELGALGLLLWTGTLAALGLNAWHARRIAGLRPYGVAVAGIFAGLLVASAFDNVKTYQAVLVAAFALAGALAGAAFGERRRAAEAPAGSAET